MPEVMVRRLSSQISTNIKSALGRVDSGSSKTPAVPLKDLSAQGPGINELAAKPTHEEGSRLIAFLACLTVAMGSFTTGTVFGYSSPSTPDIDDNPNPFHLNSEQQSWEGSIITLGGLLGGLVGGPVMDALGRKLACMAVTVPFEVGWLIMVSSSSFGCLVAGRFLTGACTGVLLLVCPVYIAEVAPASIRGIVGSLHQFAITLGILFAYSFGAFLHWSWLAIACAAVLPLWMLLLSRLPETPRWLLANDKRVGARQALQWLRGEGCDVEAELINIEQSILAASDKASLREFRQPQLLYPLLITLGLMIFQQCTGINVVMFYTVDIFTNANDSMDPQVAAIIVGAVGVVGTCVSVLVSDRSGRRPLLLVSGFLCTVAMSALGAYFYVAAWSPANVVNSIDWLPVVALVLFNFGFNVAFGPIPWVMMGELFPVRAKGVASSMATSVNRLVAFLMTKFFVDITNGIHLYGGFWLCAAFCALTIPFVLLCVPETKGISLEEIEKKFLGKRQIQNEECPP